MTPTEEIENIIKTSNNKKLRDGAIFIKKIKLRKKKLENLQWKNKERLNDAVLKALDESNLELVNLLMKNGACIRGLKRMGQHFSLEAQKIFDESLTFTKENK